MTKSADPFGVTRRVVWFCCPGAPPVVLPWAPGNYRFAPDALTRTGPGCLLQCAAALLDDPEITRFLRLSFVSLFWSPGRPKRSIVANLAPKMPPKWSPKWSQSDNGRPLRNMHRHCRIVHPPPLGSSIFTVFLESTKKSPNITYKITILKI